MVKYLTKVFFLSPLLLVIAQVQAAEGNPNAAGLEVGQVWVAGDIAKNVDNNIAPGIFYEYAASDVFALHSELIKSSHSDGKLSILSTSLGVKANLFYYDKLVPYVLLGMGVYVIEKKDIGALLETANGTLFGINFGVGSDLELSSRFFMGMFFSVHNLFGKNVTLPTSGSVYEIAGRWSGFFIRAGMRF